MFRLIGLFSSLWMLLSVSLNAQPVAPDSIENALRGALRFIVEQQIRSTIPEHQYAGEWPSVMTMRTDFMLLGKPDDVYDSNCFSTASIHNSLASAFLKRPDLTEIPPMLEHAIIRMSDFYSDKGFNFWPLLPQNKPIYAFKPTDSSQLIRRPVRFPMFLPYIRKAANIVNDNDDTSQGYTALLLYTKVQKALGREVNFTLKLSPVFNTWRDSARDSQHYYNLIHFDKRESGAFLTWRAYEAPFPTWNVPRLLVNNALFLTPMSTLYPYPNTPYMPYGANDLDAVVNANVLSALAENNEQTAAGIPEASQFIHRKVKRNDWSRAGVYYPNRYHVHYATLRAWSKGIKELDASAEMIKKHLIETQFPDGSFHSRKIVNKEDILQSTAYALNALLRLGNPYKNGLSVHVEKALRYTFTRASFNRDQTCWDGGVFFSGGTVIRNTLYWKSDVYTTALMVESLVMYQQYIKESITF